MVDPTGEIAMTELGGVDPVLGAPPRLGAPVPVAVAPSRRDGVDDVLRRPAAPTARAAGS